MAAVDLTLERETANDETATVVVIHVPSGSIVNQDDIVFDIENSKATQEVVAWASGTLIHDLEVGQVVDSGVAIAHILPAGASVAPQAAPEAIQPPPALPRPILEPSAPSAKRDGALRTHMPPRR